MQATVYDWNRSSSDSEVGRVEIRLTDVREDKQQQSYELKNAKNETVHGKNKSPTLLILGLAAFNVTSSTSSATGTYEITFEMKSCNHMPKMDVMGKCDPFFSIEVHCCTLSSTDCFLIRYEYSWTKETQ